MLDIKFVREHTQLVKDDLKKRKATDKLAMLEKALECDTEWRAIKGKTDALRAERNKVSASINETKKKGGDIAKLLLKAKQIPEELKSLDEERLRLEDEIKNLLMRLPNVTHKSVPYGPDESGNVVVEEFGKKPKIDKPKNHNDLIEGFADLDRAAKIAGSRFSLLKGNLARLEFALQQYAVDFMCEKGFSLVQPPHMMNRTAYEGVTDLNDFADVMYKIEDNDLYLIATSEHPLTAQFKDETVENLPIKLAGLSPCYRKEAGTHGKEEKGIWRMHQFNKVEQIVICKPEESEKVHEELIKNAIEFFKSLGLHFRQVLICTGDLGTVAAKKYDLEAWIPSVEAFKEVVSCSNCTTYQAVRLNIRYKEGNDHLWAHTLNSTCVATSRALVAILEQCQKKDGSVAIPKILRPYMGGQEKL